MSTTTWRTNGRRLGLSVAALIVIAAGLLRLPSPLPGHVPPPLRLGETLFAQAGQGVNGSAFFRSARFPADCTDGNAVTTLQSPCGTTAGPGPQLTFPSSPAAQTYYVDCDLGYSQATNVADAYGVQFNVAPTSTELGGVMATNATTFASGTPAIITTTTATNVIAGTPAVTTVLYAHIGGTVEIPSSGQDTVLSLLVSQATAANVVVTKRGSICRTWAVQ